MSKATIKKRPPRDSNRKKAVEALAKLTGYSVEWAYLVSRRDSKVQDHPDFKKAFENYEKFYEAFKQSEADTLNKLLRQT